MRTIIAGGGTGGHVIPALAVAAELRRRGHDQILLVGTVRGLEARLAPRHGLPLETIDVGALKRVGLAQKAATLFRLPYSFWQSGCILDSFRADVVYGVGGYASGPVLFMAAMKGIPIVVHEPNAAPGFANRCVAPFVTRALVGFPEAARYFPATRVEVVGVPVRAEFFQVPRKPHLPPFTLLVSGGSQGARSINRAVVESLPLFASSGLDVRFIHQTGEKDFREAQAAFEKCGISGQAQVLPFIDDMPAAFAAADLLICRSGASTLSEVTAAGKAAILVPFPFAADNHQLRNAQSLERAGAARVILDAELNGRRLFDAVVDMLPKLSEVEERSRALARPRAAQRIAEVLEQTAAGAGPSA
ncbi:MAG: undecaprenyldiphospho-muramoylpentapeptide beta-N-acetylglucosaminyltransferase [Acidobacteria bacterium]|nr:undecaprenyldiphospho-muramoylpentapeptide beta-N-acetylglucosaminyltransferase [Acidobacteriota bacterium]